MERESCQQSSPTGNSFPIWPLRSCVRTTVRNCEVLLANPTAPSCLMSVDPTCLSLQTVHGRRTYGSLILIHLGNVETVSSVKRETATTFTSRSILAFLLRIRTSVSMETEFVSTRNSRQSASLRKIRAPPLILSQPSARWEASQLSAGCGNAPVGGGRAAAIFVSLGYPRREMEGGRREKNKKETVRREVMGSLETAKIGGCVNNGGGGTALVDSLASPFTSV